MYRYKNHISILLPFLIILSGFLLRLINIENAPPGIYPDEAINGEDALRAIETGSYRWFYPANQGREGLFINLVAMSFRFLGASILSLKLPAILFGTLTIWGTYLLAKELFCRRLALISAFLVATSFWAINFSRISFRANMLPAILAFTFYFLFRGLRTKKYSDFAISGLIFGLGMHSYIAWRVAPLILFVLLVTLIFSRKLFLKTYWQAILIFFFTSLLSATPMFLTFWKHPEFLESRSASISIFSPAINQGHLVLTFLRSFFLSLIKYTFVGDMNWRHNYRPYPLLDPIASLAFLFGFAYSVKKTYQLLKARFIQKKRSIDVERYALLLTWFFVMLIPEFLTAEGLPHALRAIGTLPAVFILAAIPIDHYWGKALQQKKPHARKKILLLITLALVFVGVFNTLKYHSFWSKKVLVGQSFNKNITDISRFLSTRPREEEKLIITSSNTLIKLPIYIFHSKDKTIRYFFPHELEKAVPQNIDQALFVFTENNREAINHFQNKYPQLIFEEVTYPLESKFYILRN